MSIKIAVGGCRNFNDRDYIFKCLNEYQLKLDEKSRGTKSLIDYAAKLGKELCVYKI